MKTIRVVTKELDGRNGRSSAVRFEGDWFTGEVVDVETGLFSTYTVTTRYTEVDVPEDCELVHLRGPKVDGLFLAVPGVGDLSVSQVIQASRMVGTRLTFQGDR